MLLSGCVILLTMIYTACGPGVDSRVSESPITVDTVVAEPVTVIGVLDGPQEYLLGDVGSVAVHSGVIYIADRQSSTVRAYDLSGQFLAKVASKGEGPGEVMFPNDLTFDPEGRLFLRDATRLTVFDRAELGTPARSVVRTIPLGRYQIASSRGKTDGELYYFPTYYYFMFEWHSWFYQVLDSLGPTGDTVPVLGIPDPNVLGRANYPIQDGRIGRFAEGVNAAPFEPRPSWDVTLKGNILTALGERYEIVVWGRRGDTLRLIEIPSEPRRASATERSDSAAAFRSRLDSIPVPLDQVRGMSQIARSGRLPELLPNVLALHVDLAGRIWVKRWPPEGRVDQTIFDVLDSTGVPLKSIRVPADLLGDPPPWVAPDLIAGVVRDPVTEVESVAVFRLPL